MRVLERNKKEKAFGGRDSVLKRNKKEKAFGHVMVCVCGRGIRKTRGKRHGEGGGGGGRDGVCVCVEEE